MNKPEPRKVYDWHSIVSWIKVHRGINLDDMNGKRSPRWDPSKQNQDFTDIIRERTPEMHNGIIITIDGEWYEDDEGNPIDGWVKQATDVILEEFGERHKPDDPGSVDIEYWW